MTVQNRQDFANFKILLAEASDRVFFTENDFDLRVKKN